MELLIKHSAVSLDGSYCLQAEVGGYLNFPLILREEEGWENEKGSRGI